MQLVCIMNLFDSAHDSLFFDSGIPSFGYTFILELIYFLANFALIAYFVKDRLIRSRLALILLQSGLLVVDIH